MIREARESRSYVEHVQPIEDERNHQLGDDEAKERCRRDIPSMYDKSDHFSEGSEGMELGDGEIEQDCCADHEWDDEDALS